MLPFVIVSLISSFFAQVQCQNLEFAIMADWGGSEVLPSHTTPDEVKSAKMMAQRCAQTPCSFAMGVGDNIYLLGVKNEYDKRFEETFEKPFTASSLNIPFYMVAGNHDHYGNVSGEIAYSAHSTRWKFPDYNYSLTFVVPKTNVSIQIVMIDTVLLVGQTVDAEHCGNDDSKFFDHPCLLHPTGPLDVKAAEDQWTWLQNTLAVSRADYLLVAGHYPVWSIAEHGPTQQLVSRLRPMLFEYNVTAYVGGHDHTFEYLEEDNRQNVVGYIQAGGTHECTAFSTAHISDVPKGSLKWHGCDEGGFVMVNVNGTQMNAEWVSGKGSTLFAKSLKPRL